MADRYYPSLSTLISADALPGQLDFLDDFLSNIFGRFYYRNFRKLPSAEAGYNSYVIELIAFDALKLELGGSGITLFLNSDFTTGERSIIPISLSWNLPIAKYVQGFKLDTFDFSPSSFYDIIFQVEPMSDDSLILKTAFKYGTTIAPLDEFATTINSSYGSNIPVPLNTDMNVALTQIKSGISSITPSKSARQIVFNEYLLSTDNNEIFDNISDLFGSEYDEGIKSRISQLFVPKISARLILIPSIQFSRDILIPVDEITNQPIAGNTSILLGTGIEFYYSNQGSFGVNTDLSITMSPPKAQIGETGLLVSFTNILVDFSDKTSIPQATAAGYGPEFKGIFIERASIALPAKWFNNVDNTTLDVVGYNMLIGTGGFSGTIGLETIATGDPSPGVAYLNLKIGNWTVGFNHFAMTFKQNVITDSYIAGKLTIPKLKDAQDNDAEIYVNGHLNEAGDFNLIGTEPEGIPLHIFDFITINILTVELGRQNDDFYIGTSAEIWFDNPIMNKIIGDQKIVEPKLRIYDSGRFEIVGGASTIPTNISLNLGPVEVSVTGIHFGSHQQEHNGVMRKYNYWGFDGAISLDPLGVDAPRLCGHVGPPYFATPARQGSRPR